MGPRIIGIGGPSGSGKSTLAARLAAALDGRAVTISLDSYYLPLDHLTEDEREQRNFDHPDALDWQLFLAHLAALSSGQSVDEPVYRFDLHTRDAQSRRVDAAPFVIVEGILALHRQEARAIMDLRVYVETADQECYRRRMERDTVQRGRSKQSVARQYAKTVRPMAERFVWPTQRYADLVVVGDGDTDLPVGTVLAWLGLSRPPVSAG